MRDDAAVAVVVDGPALVAASFVAVVVAVGVGRAACAPEVAAVAAGRTLEIGLEPVVLATARRSMQHKADDRESRIVTSARCFLRDRYQNSD
eukprot:m.121419 g.121419  ORF g.121419 m.121419 type:complete len:92 (-) comp52094_c0_seq8:2386-2661(-)